MAYLQMGGVYYSGAGEEMKKFSFRDGMGVERLRKLMNIETGIITGENSEIVRSRAAKLDIKELHLGCTNKYLTLEEILNKRKIRAEEVAYIGDDINDAEIMELVGLSACPSDALPSIKKISHFILSNKGGQCAFREFAEIIIFFKQNLQ